MSEVTLAEVCAQVVDCEHRTAPAAACGQEYGFVVGTPSIRNGRLLLDNARRISRDTYRLWTARSVPQEGDIILTREAPVGEVAFVDGTVPLCLGQRTVLLRPDPLRVIPRFLHYLLQSPQVRHSMLARSEGSTVSHLNVAAIRELRLPSLPRMQEQLAVAAVLQALDDKIAVNERIIRTVLELGQTQYALSSLSDGWRSVQLADAARWLSGGTPKTSEPSYWGGELPWISASSLTTPWLDDSDRRVTDLGAQNGTRVIPSGSIVFVVRGMSLKREFRIGIAQREVSFGQDCKALIPHEEVSGDVLFHAIRYRSPEIIDLVDEAGHGTGRLSTDRIGGLTVRLPATNSHPIAAALKSMNQLCAMRQKETRMLASLRGSLLPRLMSGEIRVREAERVVEDAT